MLKRVEQKEVEERPMTEMHPLLNPGREVQWSPVCYADVGTELVPSHAVQEGHALLSSLFS